MANNAEVTVTNVTQAGNKLLETKDTIKYYLIIKTDKGKQIINIGKTNHDEITKLLTK